MEIQEQGISDKMMQLIALKNQYNKTRAARLVRTVSDSIIQTKNSIEEYVEGQAKRYKANKDTVADIISNYEGKLDQIITKYQNGLVNLEEKKQYYEEKKMGAMSRMVELKEEKKKITKTEIYKSWKAAYESSLERAKRIGKTGRVEEYASAMKEVERYKSECPSKEIDAEMSKGEEYIKLANQRIQEMNEKQEEWKKGALNTFSQNMINKETALAEIKPQNIFQKAIGAIVNRFAGKKRFENNITSVINGKIQKVVQDVLPDMKKQAEEIEPGMSEKPKKGIMQVIETVKNVQKNMVERIKTSLDKSIENTQEKIGERTVRREEVGPALE